MLLEAWYWSRSAFFFPVLCKILTSIGFKRDHPFYTPIGLDIVSMSCNSVLFCQHCVSTALWTCNKIYQSSKIHVGNVLARANVVLCIAWRQWYCSPNPAYIFKPGCAKSSAHTIGALYLVGPTFLKAGKDIACFENSSHFSAHLPTSVGVCQSQLMHLNPKYTML